MSLLPGEYIIMLKKELCIKCWNKGHYQYGEIWEWVEYDERLWEKGGIDCPEKYAENIEGEPGNSTRRITEPPPENCPYALEYLLDNQGKK